MILSLLGVPGSYWRVLALAERHPRRAVQRAERRVAAADPWSSCTLGWALLCWERLDAAEGQLALADAAFADRADRAGGLACAYGRLLIAQRRQMRADLVPACADLARAYAAADDPLGAALVRLDQARQLNVLGRPQEADQLLLAITPALAHDPPSLARVERARAVAAYLQGDYVSARQLLARAEATLQARRLWLDVARCWVERAAVAVYQEDLPESLAYHERAARWFACADLPLQYAFCLKGGGLVATRMGHYDLALAQTVGAIRRFQTVGRAHDLAACTLNLGNIYYQTGHWEAALAAYTQAEAQFAQSGAVGHQVIAQRNSAMAHRAQRQLDQAWQTLAEAEQHAARLGLQAEVAEIWGQQAAILLDWQQPEAAHAQYGRAAARFLSQGNAAAAAECGMEQGWLHLQSGDADAARQALALAAPHLLHHPHHAWRLRYGLGLLAARAGDVPAALAQYAAAGAGVAALRRRLADEDLSSRLYLLAAQMHRDALRLAIGHGAWEIALSCIEHQRALTLQRRIAHCRPEWAPPRQLLAAIQRALLDPQAQAIDAELTAIWPQAGAYPLPAGGAPRPPALLPTAPFSLEETRAQLCGAFGDDWTALIYVALDDQLGSFTLTSQDLHYTAIDDDAQLRYLIEQAVRPAHRHYTYADLPLQQGLTSQPWERLGQLADRLLPAPARARLGPQQRLLVVPAGPLHGLPWAALRVDDGWLAERAVVQIIPALTMLPALAGRGTAAAGALLVGCSTFGERAVALPHVAAELALVGQRWPGPALAYHNAAASLALFQDGQADHTDLALLHIASHAQLTPRDGHTAHIKLWDGDMDLAAVMRLRLAGASVVLSVCEGAAATVLPGDEVLGLHWAFLAAGAGGVLAGLWPLADRELPAVMDALYTQLRPGGDLALALAAAQRALLGGAYGPGPAAPAVWGSLSVTGGQL